MSLTKKAGDTGLEGTKLLLMRCLGDGSKTDYQVGVDCQFLFRFIRRVSRKIDCQFLLLL
jgi:hypothetical protein